MKLPNLNQSGVAHLALIVMILASIVAGTVLVQQRTQINSRADDWYREEEPQEPDPQPEPEPEQEPEQPQEPDPEPTPADEPEPVVTNPDEPPPTENPEPQPPQGNPDDPDHNTTPPDDEPLADELTEDDEGFFEKVANVVDELKDGVLDVTDELGITDGEKRREDEIADAEDEGTKIKNRLVAALNDPENAEKNKSDLKYELGLNPDASDDDLFQALRTAWSEKGIQVSGDSFEDFTIYTGQGTTVALLNPNSLTDTSLAPTTDVAMGLGAGCAGSSLGVAQSQILCGPPDLNPPVSSGPNQSVGIKVPTEDELPYCNEAGGYQSNCRAVPKELPECSAAGGYQEACVQKPQQIPVCNKFGGSQGECVFDTGDLPICAEQGFQSNCVYVPKSDPQPSTINSACLDPKKFLDPSCANGGTGPLTSKPADTLGRQTPVVLIDDEEDTTEKDRLTRERNSLQPVIDENQRKLEQTKKEIDDLRAGKRTPYEEELQKELEGLEEDLRSAPPNEQYFLKDRIEEIKGELTGYETQRSTKITTLRQNRDQYQARLDEAVKKLKLAEGRYEIKQDPEVQAKTREFNRAGDEFLARGQTDAQRDAAEQRLIKILNEKTELEDKKLLEWLEKNK